MSGKSFESESVGLCRHRRDVLKALTAFGLLSQSSAFLRADPAKNPSQLGLRLGPAEPFSFTLLKDLARRRAAAPYSPPPEIDPDIIAQLGYDAWGEISFDMDHALFAEGPGRFPVSFFPLGNFFHKSVAMHVVANGTAREILYDPSYFQMPADSPARRLSPNAGFAGLRIQEARDGALDWRHNDWVAFLGASYFRAIGALHQYGLSARAAALDVAVAGHAEEFPDFTGFFIEQDETRDGLTIYALLESPSLTGACRFVLTRDKGVTMHVDQTLSIRKPVTRFGLAPLTSMFWFSETVKPTAVDWRPEVHDSDGLAIFTGNGEHLWRPLNNPPRTMVSSFIDQHPRGFGLLQRDRIFDHYLDGVRYDLRPSLWVEPLGEWGKGAVQLVEIPTNDEIHDNIVVMWVPEQPMTAGTELNLAYKLYWQADEPFPSPLARCIATRLGNGGQPGQPRPKSIRKFMVEFLGGPLKDLLPGEKPEAVLWASRGGFSYIFTEAVPDDVPGHWRAQFDFTDSAPADTNDPVEMRLYLKTGNKVLSETWAFQYHPF
ncbi:glucan biosynthesis protein [Beijerinckia indica]|uniref:Periplasmic glucan biosynthesis protein MdoG n=1 Tax=Beijerinckia indica subsp. indica (strain ATCC 9039 / DSM 1715 / NCIMB 8712) TaxID=395963 RepID=B2IEQ5_BEII9|nr:glucan biosynthesis protein D [Beijerinckia indica]ACB96995.1 periplasmic glucan biosynthesis protein MdoG [Beijerinckia indica subsp. indica ATCC 9039]